MARTEKILLINPNWTGRRRQKQILFKRLWQPLDLAVAAALLEKDGLSTRILDNNVERLSPAEIGKLTDDFDKVFVTSTPYDRWQCPSLDIDFFFQTIRYIPRERLYIMGAHATERPEAVLRQSRARAAILGEPEQTVLEIAGRDLSKEVPMDIPGLAFFSNGCLRKTDPRQFYNDLNALPYPAYHLLPMAKYSYPLLGKDFAILEGSRGCPYGCNFCYLGLYGRFHRQKRPGRLVEEVAFVREKFQVKNIYFLDLEFGLDREFLISFCDAMIREDIRINWCCQTRVTDVDEETLRFMKKSGCNLIHFGVEAGSQRILRQTGKEIRISDCAKAVSLAHGFGIRTALFMNFGFPGETGEEMETTIRVALRLNPTYVSFHLVIPYPGTRMACRLGIDPETFPPHLFPQYNFVDHRIRTLKRVLRKAYIRYYLRPSYLKVFLGPDKGLCSGQAKLLTTALTG